MALIPPANRTNAERAAMKAFADRLALLMARAGFSQSDVARAIWGTVTDNRGRDVAKNRDRISVYLAGKQMPETRTLRKIADLFGVDIEDLYGRAPLGEGRPKRGPVPVVIATPTSAASDREATPEPTGAGDVRFTVVAGRPDVALLTINKMLPIALAVKILGMLAE